MNVLCLVTTVMVPMATIKFVIVNAYVARFPPATTPRNPSAYFDPRIFDRIHEPHCRWQADWHQHMAQTLYANCSFQQEVVQIDVALMLCRVLTITVSIQLPFESGKESPLQ
jgi:hypothetical protein